MEDLAGTVLEQLRIKDGPGPYALLYLNELKYRALVCTAKRVNGVLLYEHAYVDLHSRENLEAVATEQRIEWDFVAFTDVDAAAYFGIAFMQHDNPYSQKHIVATFHNNDTEPLFDRETGNRFYVPKVHERGFNIYQMPNGQLGCRVALDQDTLRSGLVSLMPVA